jgi:hypothetical protein
MIQPWQAKIVRASLQPSLNYLNRLRERMSKAGLQEERLYEYVCEAQKALRDLYVELHYLACEGGVYQQKEK